MNFFNTIKLNWFKKKEEEEKFARQNRQVLKVFLDYGNQMTPWQVKGYARTIDNYFGLNDAPITSIRRAINTLTKKGFLVKTNTKTMERLGKPNYCWKLNYKKIIDEKIYK